VVLFIFIVILAFFFGEGGIVEIIRSRSKIEELRMTIAQLEKERDTLLKEIEELKKNPMALEKTAREKLWLMKKNEKVVVIIKNNDKKNGEK
jgi:cell division protein FtsB